MCKECEDTLGATVIGHMAQNNLHLEVALRVTRDAATQALLNDREGMSDEGVVHELLKVQGYMDTIAERLRGVSPAALQAAVWLVKPS